MEVTLKNVTKVFSNKVRAVDDFSVDIRTGEFFFLLGPSGCGKTTILRMVAGFEKTTSGEIFFDNASVTHVPPQKRNIGMVFQNYALWPHMTVEKNVSYGLQFRHLTAAEKKRRIDEVLDIVQMLDYKTRMPNQLSGGQQQRIALARALVIRPGLLLFDEPLSNLDTKLRLELRDEIKRIHEQTKITTIYVTHDQKEALSMADYVVVMDNGRLAQKGAPIEVYRHPVNKFIAGFIGETNFVPARVTEVTPDKTHLESPLGAIETGWTSDKRTVGQNVLLSIRPESFWVGVDDVPDMNVFEAHVRKKVYLGEVEQYELVGGGDTVLRAWRFNPKDEGYTGAIRIAVRPRDIIVLEEEISL